MRRKIGALGAVLFVEDDAFEEEMAFYSPYLSSRLRLFMEEVVQQEFVVILPRSAYRRVFQGDLGSHGESLGRFSMRAEVSQEILETENVVAYLEGTDKSDEVLVLSAHYDHLGVRGRDIYYGADDNASGTAALLEIAEAFVEAKQQGRAPRRTVLFLLLTGEEKGLLGSDYYVQNASFPLSQTVANLNIDMIGRTDEAHDKNPNYVYLIGSDRLSSDLHAWSEEANALYTQLDLDYTFNDKDDPNRFYYRSDHYNFARHGIPIIFYFSGVHKDYHRPTDTPEKVMYPKLAHIARLVFYTAYDVSVRSDRPLVDRIR